MSAYAPRQSRDEKAIIVERDGSPSLHFASTEQYANWERAYLVCDLINGNPDVCFVMNPPQVPVGGKRKPKMRRT